MHRLDGTLAAPARPSGRAGGLDRLFPEIYAELRALARRYLRAERHHTVQPTALVHEAYVRLARLERVSWKGRTHVFAAAASEMRRALVEHARAALRKKRGGRPWRITLSEEVAPSREPGVELLALDEALERLARRSRRRARTAELRLFAGMTSREIATVLGVSEDTATDDWKVARAWLMRWLAPREGRA
jgi:RNA polymerase sigma factor (TIGR02999 family)